MTCAARSRRFVPSPFVFLWQVIPVRSTADPFLFAVPLVQKGQIVSITTRAEPLLLAIPHLYQLSSFPTVVHVVLADGPTPDLSAITALRQTGFTIIHSTSLQEAQDLALASHILALSSGKGVIHFSESTYEDVPIPYESAGALISKLSSDEGPSRPSRNISATLYAVSPRRSHDAEPPTTALETLGSPHRNGITSGNPPIQQNGSNGAHEPNGEQTHGNHVPRDIGFLIDETLQQIEKMTGRVYHCFEYFGSPAVEEVLVFFGSQLNQFQAALSSAQSSDSFFRLGLLFVRIYRPWSSDQLRNSIPPAVKRIGVAEQIHRRPIKWGPVFIDVLASIHDFADVKVTSYVLGQVTQDSISSALHTIVSNMRSDIPQQNLVIGEPASNRPETRVLQPILENAYVKVLHQLFGEKLHILNPSGQRDPSLVREIMSSPEYLLGSYVARLETRKSVVSQLSSMVRNKQLRSEGLHALVTSLQDGAVDTLPAEALGSLFTSLRTSHDPLYHRLRADPWLFKGETPWIIGSESWAYDLGSSGIHHVIASGLNINMLVIDSQPYSQRGHQSAENRKKDIGLYAMNFGNAYVASVAIYSSYTQVMHALVEAQKFNGPAIVLAYLPYSSELDSPLQVLQDTKMAVDSGYWPLYRWTPAIAPSTQPTFQLDSERVKKELQTFIDRENHLTHLTREKLVLTAAVSHSRGSELREIRNRSAREAMEKLMDGLSGPPVLILFASDGGNAENVAKRLSRRGRARGLKGRLSSMDDFPLEDLAVEKNVIFITSTAGQGEFPQNGRATWDALKSSTDMDLSGMNYTVFGLGDSHYWPRKEDKLYYNKPGKDLDSRLTALGAKRMTEVGLGDDQDPDGFETGYNNWEPQVWSALGVDQVDADFEEPKPLTNEDIKIGSNFLRGTIAEGLADTSTGAISEADAQLTKFHGTYMQDDRDIRDERKSLGLEPAYSFMVRVRMSGGVCQPEQWIAMDEISSEWGNDTFKLVHRPRECVSLFLDHQTDLSIPRVNFSGDLS
jgi:sulfite reductase (NADPH) hemoprotein beta-component